MGNNKGTPKYYMEKAAEFEAELLNTMPDIFYKVFKEDFDVLMDRIWEDTEERKAILVLDKPSKVPKEKWFNASMEERQKIIGEVVFKDINWKTLNEKEKMSWIKSFDLQAYFKAVYYDKDAEKLFNEKNPIRLRKQREIMNDMILWRNKRVSHKTVDAFEKYDDESFLRLIVNPVRNLTNYLKRENESECKSVEKLIEKVKQEIELPPIPINEITEYISISDKAVKFHLDELGIGYENDTVVGQEIHSLIGKIIRLHGINNTDKTDNKEEIIGQITEQKETKQLDVPDKKDSKKDINILSEFSKSKLNEQQLNRLIVNYNIVIDASCLLSESYAKTLMYGLGDVLLKNNKKALVFRRTRMELVDGERNYYEQKKSGVSESENIYAKYKGAINILDRLSERHLIVYGNGYPESVNEEDDIENLIKTHSNSNICLLTPEDDYLNNDSVRSCKNFISLRTVADRLFVRSKYLEKTHEDKKNSKSNEGGVEKIHDNQLEQADNNQERHNQSRRVVKKDELVKNVSVNAEEAKNISFDAVNGITYQMIDKLGAGGEGVVYQTQFDDTVAKIYYKDKITVNRQNKLKDMVNIKLNIENVAWPLDLLLDKNENVIGYTMKKVPADCVEMGISVLKISSNRVREELLPKWNRLDIVLCAYAITKIFSSLHEKDILMGDINPRNIMVNPKDSSEVWFVDCDSYQFKQYNCPVGTPIFTSPRIYKEYGNQPNYSEIFRTEEDEQYAVASLLFQMLMAGQSPFASKRSDNTGIEDAIKNGKFAYSRETDEEIPDGPYMMIWNNMLGSIKVCFQDAFVNGKIVTTSEWIQQLKSYQWSINKGWLSSEIFPKKYKSKNPNEFAEFKCEICKKEANMPMKKYQYAIERNHIIACNECNIFLNQFKDKKVEARCDKCGTLVTDIPQIKIVQNAYRDPSKREEILCHKCFKERKVSS